MIRLLPFALCPLCLFAALAAAQDVPTAPKAPIPDEPVVQRNLPPIAVEFVQDKCEFCDELKPVVSALQKEGYDLQTVNISRDKVSFGWLGKQFDASGKQVISAFKVAQTPTVLVLSFDPAGKLLIARLEERDAAGLRTQFKRWGMTPRPRAPGT